MNSLLRVFSLVRKFLFKMVNKEFLTFLFFLILSAIFWMMMTLNEVVESEITLELRLQNVPKNVIITNEMPTAVRFTLRDKGIMMGSYIFGEVLQPITVDFATYAKGKGYGSVPVSDIQKQILAQLPKSTKLGSIKPEKIEFYYNFGRFKKVPVKMLGKVTPSSSYYLSQVVFTPDSVSVYASKTLLDSIHAAFTERLFVDNFSDTIVKTLSLRKVKGAKFEPATTEVKLIPDILTEETVEVPIEAINVPDDMVLRMFPSKVKVRFVVGANRLSTLPKNAETKALLPIGFRLVADCNSILRHQTEKCRIYVRAVPAGVRDARPELAEVDYLLEQQ